MNTRSATQRVADSFEAGASARCATSAKITRSAACPSSRRPDATRQIAWPISSRSHSRPSTHDPPIRRASSTSTLPAAAAATACSGSRNRLIEATSRRSASRSTRSARPKLWITLATGLPVRGCRSLCASCRYDTTVPSLFRRRDSRRYTPTRQAIRAAQRKRHADNRVPTPFPGSRHLLIPLTSESSHGQAGNAYELRNSGQHCEARSLQVTDPTAGSGASSDDYSVVVTGASGCHVHVRWEFLDGTDGGE